MTNKLKDLQRQAIELAIDYGKKFKSESFEETWVDICKPVKDGGGEIWKVEYTRDEDDELNFGEIFVDLDNHTAFEQLERIVNWDEFEVKITEREAEMLVRESLVQRGFSDSKVMGAEKSTTDDEPTWIVYAFSRDCYLPSNALGRIYVNALTGELDTGRP